MNVRLISVKIWIFIKKKKILPEEVSFFKKNLYLCRYKLLKLEHNEKIIFSIRISSSIISKLLQ